MNERYEQQEQPEQKELSELMERDTAAEQLYTEYNWNKIEADVGNHKDMQEYYQSKCSELVQEKAAALEQLELTQAQRDDLVEQYDTYAQECLKSGHPELYTYYHEASKALRQEGNQEWNEQFQEKVKKDLADCQETMDELKEWKSVHFAPKYSGGPTSQEYQYDAQKEYEENGESARFKYLIDMASKLELKEKYPEIFK